MPRPSVFIIRPADPSCCYKAGSVLKGTVFVTLLEPVYCRALRVKISGRIHAEWEKSSSNPSDSTVSHRRQVSATELTISETITLWGKGESGVLVTGNDMPPGQYSFPFQCQLPPHLESSFESDIGHIRYEMVALFDRPWKSDYVTSVPFTIMKPLDMTPFSFPTETASSPIEKMCCFPLPWLQRRTSICLKLPKTAFQIADFIEIHVFVSRSSSIDTVRSVEVSLRRNVHYHAQGESLSNSTTVSKTTLPITMASELQSHCHTRLYVSDSLSPSIRTNIIRVEYSILAKISNERFWCASAIKTSVDIHIGPRIYHPSPNPPSDFLLNSDGMNPPFSSDNEGTKKSPPPYSAHSNPASPHILIDTNIPASSSMMPPQTPVLLTLPPGQANFGGQQHANLSASDRVSFHPSSRNANDYPNSNSTRSSSSSSSRPMGKQ